MSSTVASRTALSSGLRISVMRLARRLRAERSDHGLTLGQLSVLAGLDRHGPMTPGEVAVHEGIRPPSATRTVAALTELGLVTRAAHPSDGRQVVITITPAARVLLHEDRRRRDAWLAAALESLPQDERAILVAAAPILDRLAGS
jgi:DNA-binding MarR family transcriptional regulator